MHGRPSSLAVFALLAAALAAGAEETSPEVLQGTRPEIAFDRTLHDFGRAAMGQELRTSFTVHNVGDETLLIERVVPG